MSRTAAEIIREYGPFPGVDNVGGVTYDGRHVWFAAGDKLIAFDPVSRKTVRSIDVAARAGTAFDGRHLFQIAGEKGRYFALSSPIASSRGSPGLTESSGTAPANANVVNALLEA